MFGNAHQVMYVVSGSGRIEVGSNDGQTILHDNVQKGSVLVIPKFLPSVRVSGDEGLTFISFLTSPRYQRIVWNLRFLVSLILLDIRHRFHLLMLELIYDSTSC
jgi:oxalate decarboxylase/phosphoglucose isomerase-like protein (cupin superfamily)